MKNAESLAGKPKNHRGAFAGLLLGFLLLLALSLSACGSTTPEEPDMVTVGVISLAPVFEPIYEGFQAKMTELGYVEGENITYLYDGPVGDIGQLDIVAQEMVAQNVDLLLAFSTPATQASMRATTEIPIMFAPISDPIGAGLVSSLANPGKNATGVTFGVGEPRRLQWLLDIAPGIEQIYLPYNPNDGSAVGILQKIQEVATPLNVELLLREAPDEAGIAAAIENIPDEADAVFLLPDSFLVSRITEFAEAAIAHKLPISAPGDTTVPDGGLITYSMRFYPVGEQLAVMAQKILQGASASELPVETAEFFLDINLKTANAIGLEISDDILRQANTIIRE